MKFHVINQSGMRFSLKGFEGLAVRIFGHLTKVGLWRRKEIQIGLIFVTARESRRLNSLFLGKNRPTNVLSFDYGEYAEIVLAPEVIRKEASRGGVPFFEQTARLILHSAIHLAGVHHERSVAMEKKFYELEKKLLQRLSVKLRI